MGGSSSSSSGGSRPSRLSDVLLSPRLSEAAGDDAERQGPFPRSLRKHAAACSHSETCQRQSQDSELQQQHSLLPSKLHTAEARQKSRRRHRREQLLQQLHRQHHEQQSTPLSSTSGDASGSLFSQTKAKKQQQHMPIHYYESLKTPEGAKESTATPPAATAEAAGTGGSQLTSLQEELRSLRERLLKPLRDARRAAASPQQPPPPSPSPARSSMQLPVPLREKELLSSSSAKGLLEYAETEIHAKQQSSPQDCFAAVSAPEKVYIHHSSRELHPQLRDHRSQNHHRREVCTIAFEPARHTTEGSASTQLKQEFSTPAVAAAHQVRGRMQRGSQSGSNRITAPSQPSQRLISPKAAAATAVAKTPETAAKTPETAAKTPETAAKTPETAAKTPATAAKIPATAAKTPATTTLATETPESSSHSLTAALVAQPTAETLVKKSAATISVGGEGSLGGAASIEKVRSLIGRSGGLKDACVHSERTARRQAEQLGEAKRMQERAVDSQQERQEQFGEIQQQEEHPVREAEAALCDDELQLQQKKETVTPPTALPKLEASEIPKTPPRLPLNFDGFCLLPPPCISGSTIGYGPPADWQQPLLLQQDLQQRQQQLFFAASLAEAPAKKGLVEPPCSSLEGSAADMWALTTATATSDAASGAAAAFDCNTTVAAATAPPADRACRRLSEGEKRATGLQQLGRWKAAQDAQTLRDNGIVGVRLSDIPTEWHRLYGCDLSTPLHRSGYNDVASLVDAVSGLFVLGQGDGARCLVTLPPAADQAQENVHRTLDEVHLPVKVLPSMASGCDRLKSFIVANE
ncbi:hypothetical protein cyc_06149 [Cyclospora cayetanensis]|uniref:Uncharacterized protein n=1 Tax=Cyclospora cayetanensis TaxID=88456 RepID=A0A1D3D764_9EIME|nr:hypothetical protein cyc_06149 [Cyclospora cayetanensis]